MICHPPGVSSNAGGRTVAFRSGGVGERGQADEVETAAAAGEDLSVPMWVWTLLGFTLVTAVVIIVIIWGGAQKSVGPEEDPLMMEDAAQTVPAEGEPAATEPAATEPSSSSGG